MSKSNDPAFPAQPTTHLAGGVSISANPGMTKLEYFAGLAMQGLCANSNLKQDIIVGEMSVRLAAALIAELEKHHE